MFCPSYLFIYHHICFYIFNCILRVLVCLLSQLTIYPSVVTDYITVFKFITYVYLSLDFFFLPGLIWFLVIGSSCSSVDSVYTFLNFTQFTYLILSKFYFYFYCILLQRLIFFYTLSFSHPSFVCILLLLLLPKKGRVEKRERRKGKLSILL